ncbi:MAG: hypothetical protein HOA17_03980, partial [Candidatus Melainabacteria bacterium]|nr:hypothetical protein [Candidatus Melainabacteria bacterium]
MINELRSPAATTTIDRAETTRRDGAIRDLPDNTAAIRAMNLPVEEAPKFDYRSHSFEEAVVHIAKDLAGAVLKGYAGAGIRALYLSIKHHNITFDDLFK